MYRVKPIFLLVLGVAIGTILGVALVMHDAATGGGTYVPKYEHCSNATR
jgi:hypothetical protein